MSSQKEKTSPFMAKAIEAALSAKSITSPNPWVGALLEHQGQIINVSSTKKYGAAHAEAQTLQGKHLSGGTLYTTLEPCVAFEGKRTEPCTQIIIESGVKKVVIGIEDPDPRVKGRGIIQLREAGIEVQIGDGADEITRLLRPYIKHRQTGLPYVIAKFAASIDGKIATKTGASQWITGEKARDTAHHQRAWVDGILIGSGTAISDNPSLTARPKNLSPEQFTQPLRIVLDGSGKLPVNSKILQPTGTIIATSPKSEKNWQDSLTEQGAQIIICEPSQNGSGINLEQLLQVLGSRSILSLWVEGGSQILGSFFSQNLIDELWAFIAPIIIGGDGLSAISTTGTSTLAEVPHLREIVIEKLEQDFLVRGFTGNWAP